MKHYTHLTEVERYQISALLKSGNSLSVIARILGKNRSTISREIKRNCGQRGYRPKQAQKFSLERKATNSHKLNDFFWCYVEHLIKHYYSPEQVSGRLTFLGWEGVASVEHIYRYIYRDKARGGTLHTYLRSQKHYRKRTLSGQERRGQIKERRDITERPAIVDARMRYGDYEGDTLVGKNHKGAVVTLVDRVTKMIKIKALPNRQAHLVKAACISLLKGEQVNSITFDNGKEFAAHEAIALALNTDIYFATPYHSWERGTNENTNGLIRQFLPKNRKLDNLRDDEIKWIEHNLNHRPRKMLNYQTPFEVLSKNRGVALRC